MSVYLSLRYFQSLVTKEMFYKNDETILHEIRKNINVIIKYQCDTLKSMGWKVKY